MACVAILLRVLRYAVFSAPSTSHVLDDPEPAKAFSALLDSYLLVTATHEDAK